MRPAEIIFPPTGLLAYRPIPQKILATTPVAGATTKVIPKIISLAYKDLGQVDCSGLLRESPIYGAWLDDFPQLKDFWEKSFFRNRNRKILRIFKVSLSSAVD